MTVTTAVQRTAAIHPGTLKLLGGPKVVVRHAKRRPAGSIALKYAAVENLSDYLDLSTPRVMRLIIANERTAQRRKEQGALTEEESDRLTRVARITRRAVEAFGNATQAKTWLCRDNRTLGGQAPLELLGTDAGAEAVTDELGRVELGELY